MWELIKFVIPKIKAHWEHLAICMRYTVGEIDAFEKDSHNLEECCEKLFSDWLTTDHGPKHKTYQTLFNHIKQVNNLSEVSEEIEKELIEGIARNNHVA